MNKLFWVIGFCLISLLIFIPNIAVADGVVNSDGYVHTDGFYVKNGISYTRDIVWYKDWSWVNACYVGNCYKAGYWTYVWKYYYEYTPVKLPSASDPEWRTKLLAIAAARDVAEGKLRYAAQEQTSFLEAVNALGFQGNFRMEAYGRNPMAPTNYGNLQLSSAGVNGNTVYGYSYTHAVDAYGQTDLNSLYQQSSRLTQNAQSLAGQANTEFSELVKQAGGNAARIAEILAKGEAGRKIIDGIKGSPETKTTTTITGTTSIPGSSQQGVVQASNISFLKLSGPATCVSCHSGKKLEGGFDISKVPSMSADEIVKKVLPRLVSSDDKFRMPQGLPALTAEQVRQFMGGGE